MSSPYDFHRRRGGLRPQFQTGQTPYNRGQSTRILSNGKTSRMLDGNNQLRTYSVKYGDKYLTVPITGDYPSEPPEIKTMIWNRLIQALDHADLPATDKIDCLVQRLNFTGERSEAEQATQDFLNPMSTIYGWNFQILQTSAFVAVVVPAAGIDDPVRQAARYAVFELTLSPASSVDR